MKLVVVAFLCTVLCVSGNSARGESIYWTPGEDARLKIGVERFGSDNWGSVAVCVETKNLRQCRGRWRHLSVQWTTEEDDTLRAATEALGTDNWKEVAARVGRSSGECCQRSLILLRGRIRNVWTTEDNEKLQAVVEDIGTGNWDEVAARVVTRTARQCRERWQNYLCASVPREPWTNDEDRLLLEKVGMWGRKWRRIAQFLQGRTDLDVKKRFFTLNTPQPGHAAAFNVVNPQLGTAADALRGSVQVPLELAAPEGTTGIGAPGGVAPDGVGAQ